VPELLKDSIKKELDALSGKLVNSRELCAGTSDEESSEDSFAMVEDAQSSNKPTDNKSGA